MPVITMKIITCTITFTINSHALNTIYFHFFKSTDRKKSGNKKEMYSIPILVFFYLLK